MEWLDAGFSTEELGHTRLSRLRALQAVAAVLVLASPLYVLQLFTLRLYPALFTLLLAVGAAPVAVKIARSGRVELGAHLLTFNLLVTITVALTAAGGLRHPGAAWLLIVPLCGGLLAGSRASVRWSAATLLVATSLWCLDTLGYPLQDPVAPELRWMYILVDYVVLVIAMGSMLRVYGAAERGMREELASANAALRQEVAERTAAEKVAVEAAMARSTFLATMSHEIRTPLNGLLGLTTLLSETELTSSQRELAGAAHRSSELLHALLDDILDFSKIDAGHLELESVPLHLGDLCADVVGMWSSLAAERSLELRVEHPPDDGGWVLGDPTRLRQIVGNLVSNAMKFTEEGCIDVRWHRRDGQVVIEVEDTGVGMNPDAVANIFDAFRQADSSTTRQYGGTGLGLAICKRISESMGGTLSLQSHEGFGTVFTLELPLEGAAAPAPVEVVEELDVSVLTGKRVLVAEDNPVNRMLVERLLQRIGVRVVVAVDGFECVAKWREGGADLILMDCNMPRCDGYEATSMIRADGGRLPIIAVTANTMPVEIQRCYDSGMDAYLGKPVRADELERAMVRCLEGTLEVV